MNQTRSPLVYIFILTAFLVNTLGPVPLAQAQLASPDGDLRLPAPGVRIHLSPPLDPPVLKGIKVHADNPFRFDFILDQGDLYRRHVPRKAGYVSPQEQLKQQATRLIKYFLASLTIPEKDLWVNLSPYEKDRIIPQSFGLTEMGRDLLAEDYMLKQITASLIYPEDETGKKFWRRIYEEAAKKFGTTNIPVNTFNKVWIVPEKATVYENAKAGAAYIVESKLKVMLEQDYLALEKNQRQPGDMALAVSPSRSPSSEALDVRASQGNVGSTNQDVNALGSQIVREIVIPELTREVNENKNFVQLRQVYNSLILATWYKKKIKDSILAQVYEDKNKIQGLVIPAPSTVIPAEAGIQVNDVESIYQRYLRAFKKGVYNYIKEEQDPLTQETIPRKYFSGGTTFDDAAMAHALNFISDPNQITERTGHEFLVGAGIDVIPRQGRADQAMTVDSKIASIMAFSSRGDSSFKGHSPENLKKFFDAYLEAGNFLKLNEKEENLEKQIRSISRIVQRMLLKLGINERYFRDFVINNKEQAIHLRERGLVLESITLSHRHNTTEPFLLRSIKVMDRWLDVPLPSIRSEEFESELSKIGFWGMNVNREIKNGIARELIWLLDKINEENPNGKEQWEAAVLRTAWELNLLGNEISKVQQMFHRELRIRGYDVEKLESILKERPIPPLQPLGEPRPLFKRTLQEATVQEAREWDVYRVTGRNWYWDFWPPGRRQLVKDRLEILLKDGIYVQFVKDLVAKLYPASGVKVEAIIVSGSYLYGYEELKGTDVDTIVILSGGEKNVLPFLHQSFTAPELKEMNLRTNFSLPEDYWRKVSDFDFIFKTESGIRGLDLALIWGSGITIYGKDYSDRKPDQMTLLRHSLGLLQNGIVKMWDYPLASHTDVDYMFGKIVKRLTEASLVLNQLYPDEFSQFSDLDYYPQFISSYYKALTERKVKNKKVEQDFLEGIFKTYLQRLDFIKSKIDAMTNPDERWNDYVALLRIIRGIDRVTNFGNNSELPELYKDVHEIVKRIAGPHLVLKDQAMTAKKRNEIWIGLLSKYLSLYQPQSDWVYNTLERFQKHLKEKESVYKKNEELQTYLEEYAVIEFYISKSGRYSVKESKEVKERIKRIVNIVFKGYPLYSLQAKGSQPALPFQTGSVDHAMAGPTEMDKRFGVARKLLIRLGAKRPHLNDVILWEQIEAKLGHYKTAILYTPPPFHKNPDDETIWRFLEREEGDPSTGGGDPATKPQLHDTIIGDAEMIINRIKGNPGNAEAVLDDIKAKATPKKNKAMMAKYGGIDLTPAKMNLQTKVDSRLRGNDNEIKFHLDPAMLERLRNAPGFVPVTVNIQPLTDLRQFLGLKEQETIVSPALSN